MPTPLAMSYSIHTNKDKIMSFMLMNLRQEKYEELFFLKRKPVLLSGNAHAFFQVMMF
jgi:hypothetical protein